MNRHDLMLRVRALLFPKRVERELEDELDFHIEMQRRKNIAAGMDPSDALHRARLQFGGSSQIKEECRSARRLGLIETTWQDIRYAVRGFRRSPVFVLTVVATIALGLGLDTALFTIFNATYLRPIGIQDPKSLYELYWTDRAGVSHDYSWPEYREVLAQNPALKQAMGYRNVEARIDGRTVLGALVTGEYFQVLGIGATLGRTLLPGDSSVPGREPVAMLSYRCWQTRFSSDPAIIGRKVILRGYPFEMVGIAPEHFSGLGARPSEFWIPFSMAARFGIGTDEPGAITIAGRLKPEFRVGQAEAGLTLWAQRFTANGPDSAKAVHTTLISRSTVKPFSFKNAVTFSSILVAFSLVLLIGCANVANMMLARSLSRQREIGIRLSLGASRSRLIRQLLTESILLGIPSAIAGIAVCQATIAICVRVLIATLPPGVSDFASRIPQLTLDTHVAVFTLAAAVLSAVLFGLAPALQATRANVMQAAKGDFNNEFRPSRLRNSLLVGQVTVCVLLLVTAGLLLRGVDQVHAQDATLSTRNTIQLAIQDKSREQVLSLLAAEPVVEVVAAAASAPVERKLTISIEPEGGATNPNTPANIVSPEYFATFEIPILRGRSFTADEARSSAPVAIVSQTAAKRLWPNQEAVGRSLRMIPDRKADPRLRQYESVNVIGVVRDEISRSIGSGEDSSLIYFPNNSHAAGNQLFVTPRGDLEAARRKIEADLSTLDADAVTQIARLQIQEWVAEDAYYTIRVAYWLSSAIGLLALLLTLSGIYGVVSYVVSQRTKEIGIRMAMGATSRAVTGLVLRQSMRLAIIGAVTGAASAMAMSRILGSALALFNAFDAVAYIGGIALVLASCAAAAYFPSRRASRIDPLTTLRYD